MGDGKAKQGMALGQAGEKMSWRERHNASNVNTGLTGWHSRFRMARLRKTRCRPSETSLRDLGPGRSN
jgi:hypothetical protein